MFDEAGKSITMTEQLAEKLSLSWCRRSSQTDIKSGNLPVIDTPQKVEAEPRFYKIDVIGTEVSFSFSIRYVTGFDEVFQVFNS